MRHYLVALRVADRLAQEDLIRNRRPVSFGPNEKAPVETPFGSGWQTPSTGTSGMNVHRQKVRECMLKWLRSPLAFAMFESCSDEPIESALL